MKAVPEGVAMFVRPDWKDAKAYADVLRASLSRIAWEFLRRNPAYQKAFGEYASRVRELAKGDIELAQHIERVLTPSQSKTEVLEVSVCNSLAQRLKEAGFRAAIPGNPNHFMPLNRQFGKQWGLEGMPHPAEASMLNVCFENWAGVIFPSSSGLRILEEDESDFCSRPNSKWLVIQVDVSLPLQVIESVVLDAIKLERKCKIESGAIKPINNRALPNARYLEYLRILDGLDAGVSIADIGGVLAPKAVNEPPERQRDKRFRAAQKQAVLLQSDGYRVLPMLQKTMLKNKKK